MRAFLPPRGGRRSTARLTTLVACMPPRRTCRVPSAPMVMAAVAASRGKDATRSPMIVIGDSLDDAGYPTTDLSRVLGEEAVMMPSGYKRRP